MRMIVILIILASYSCQAEKLAVQYPPNVCSTGYVSPCVSNPPQTFTIHGLWPNENTTPTNRTFNGNLLTGQLLSDLHRYWPNIKRGSTDENFWKYEWETHGPYYHVGSESQVEFFSQTVNLFLTQEISRALSAVLLYQGSKNVTDTLQQLQQITGVMPQLICRNSTQTLFLVEIRFCLLPADLITLRNCSPRQSEGCNPAFYVNQ